MSTTLYNPGDAHAAPVGALRKQSVPYAGSKPSNSLGSKPLSRASLRDADFVGSNGVESEDDLITAAQNGDEHAFMLLCGRYSSMVKMRIRRIVRNQEDAEDALQDTLMRAYLHLTSFRRSCKFSTWLTTIGVNSALMIVRKRRLRRETNTDASSLDTGPLEPQEPVDRSPGQEELYSKRQAILLLRREVEKLHPSLRSVVSHYYGSDCSLEETAISQEISLAAAKSRLMRGRVWLRSRLSKYGLSKSDH
jgi:RNA polymerase sigma-70 factor (ECF subfamily)